MLMMAELAAISALGRRRLLSAMPLFHFTPACRYWLFRFDIAPRRRHVFQSRQYFRY
jgi:hypothetical protein